VYGSQAVLLSRGACEYTVANWARRPPGMQDIIFSRMAFEFDRRPLFVHTPSLVEHVGGGSTWGGAAHTAVDFDPDFRAPGL
jgi:hypothetical protein